MRPTAGRRRAGLLRSMVGRTAGAKELASSSAAAGDGAGADARYLGRDEEQARSSCERFVAVRIESHRDPA